MTVCRFFQQGYCRYGNSCHFEHVSQNYGNKGQQRNASVYKVENPPQNVTTEQLIDQVVSDTSSAVNGHQWCLTCYGPFRSKPNFPGMADVSPEEVRSQFYEARTNGTLQQIETEVARLAAASMEKLKALSNPTGRAVAVIENLYRNETANEDPFGTPVRSQNVFGQNADGGGSALFAEAAKNIFQTSAPSPSDIFARPAQTNAGFDQQQGSVFANNANIFAQNQNAVSPAKLFGEAANNIGTASGIFNRPTEAVAANENPFGAQTRSSNVFQPAKSENVFSNANPFAPRIEVDHDIYSKFEDLTEEELNAYKSDFFLPGQIPEAPPPLELCD